MTEVERLRDRVEQLEEALGVDRGRIGKLRDIFGLEPLQARTLGMLLERPFVSREGLYAVLYESRHEEDWPLPKTLDANMCRMRKRLDDKGIEIRTIFGEGWTMPVESKVKLRAMLADRPIEDRRADFLAGA